MHRSSETIAALAAALAKAQIALTNPDKSLTGTLPGNGPEPGRVPLCVAVCRSRHRPPGQRLSQWVNRRLPKSIIDADRETVKFQIDIRLIIRKENGRGAEVHVVVLDLGSPVGRDGPF